LLTTDKQRAFVNAVGKSPRDGRLAAEKQGEHVNWSCGDLTDLYQSCRVQAHGGLWTDARQPTIQQRMKELLFVSTRHSSKRGRLVQFGCNLTDQFVRANAFA